MMFVVYGEDSEGGAFEYCRTWDEMSARATYARAEGRLEDLGYECLDKWEGEDQTEFAVWLRERVASGGAIGELAEYVRGLRVKPVRLSLWERPEDGAMAVLWVEAREDGA